MLAHVGGLPVEETAAALLSTGGVVIVAVRLLALRYRRVSPPARVRPPSR